MKNCVTVFLDVVIMSAKNLKIAFIIQKAGLVYYHNDWKALAITEKTIRKLNLRNNNNQINNNQINNKKA